MLVECNLGIKTISTVAHSQVSWPERHERDQSLDKQCRRRTKVRGNDGRTIHRMFNEAEPAGGYCGGQRAAISREAMTRPKERERTAAKEGIAGYRNSRSATRN